MSGDAAAAAAAAAAADGTELSTDEDNNNNNNNNNTGVDTNNNSNKNDTVAPSFSSLSKDRQQEWIQSLTKDDLSVDLEPTTFVGKEKTILKSIKGVSPNVLKVDQLQAIARHLKIEGYRKSGIKKPMLCDLIGRHKTGDEYYNAQYNRDNNNSSSSLSKKLPPKSARPSFITKEGTYYRLVMAVTAPEVRHAAVNFGRQPAREQQDNHDIFQSEHHKTVADYYNDAVKLLLVELFLDMILPIQPSMNPFSISLFLFID